MRTMRRAAFTRDSPCMRPICWAYLPCQQRLVLHDYGLHGDLHESCWVWLEEQGARRHRKCSAPQKEPGEVVDERLEETREQCESEIMSPTDVVIRL
jgi:hypothetical protein